SAAEPAPRQAGKSVIYIFLSGGLSQLDSFDLKPSAPAEIRGEFRPMATRTPGIHICEHLPRLAQRSHLWALVRSMSHPSTSHSHGHTMMLTGRTQLQPGYDPNRPQPTDWPSLAAIVGRVLPQRSQLPSAVVLPEKIVHRTGRVIPGQFAGQMGPRHDPWFIEASPYRASIYGAYPEYAFTMQPEEPFVRGPSVFQAPSLALPAGLTPGQMQSRLGLLERVQRHPLGSDAAAAQFERRRERAVALLSDPRLRRAFDVTRADRRLQE